MVAGISMGGINTLIASLKKRKFYTKAAVICPPLPTVSPHDSLSDLWSYFRESSLSLMRAPLFWWFSKKIYPTKQVWESNNPLPLSKKLNSDYTLSLYLTCGKNDEWGCMIGSEALIENMKKTKIQIEWVPLPGGHCDTDYPSLAGFLVSSLKRDLHSEPGLIYGLSASVNRTWFPF